MPEYTIKRVSGWEETESLPSLSMTTSYRGEYPDIALEARVGYDAEQLYVYLKAKEEHLRAEEKNPLGESCSDSCCEFFFGPQDGDLRYFNVECSASGCIYLGFGTDINTLIRLIPERGNVNKLLEERIDLIPGGFEVRFVLKAEFIRRFFPDFRLESGRICRGNVYKCGDLTDHPHWLSWSPVHLEKLSFHWPKDFGRFILE